MYKIFEGPHGYYIARELPNGDHHQPDDKGARIGWDLARAKRELKEAINSTDEA